MNRRLLISIHLYLSSFFAATVVMMALSGGLYLIGIKGEVKKTEVTTLTGGEAFLADASKPAMTDLLERAGISNFHFDYVKGRDQRFFTRPTSEQHYIAEVSGDSIAIYRAEPSLQKRMVELHLGHGPSVFKTFQKVFAAGMLFIILSGVWLGVSSGMLRKRTLLATGAGLLVFAGLIMS